MRTACSLSVRSRQRAARHARAAESVVWATCWLLAASPLAAQVVTAGDRVRVSSDVVSGIMQVTAVANDTLILEQGGLVARVPAGTIRRLAIWRGERDAGQRAKIGATVGAVVFGLGTALMLILVATGDDGYPVDTWDQVMIIGGGVIIGAGVGALSGVSGRFRDKWQRVNLGSRAWLGVSSQGDLVLRYRIRF